MQHPRVQLKPPRAYSKVTYMKWRWRGQAIDASHAQALSLVRRGLCQSASFNYNKIHKWAINQYEIHSVVRLFRRQTHCHGKITTLASSVRAYIQFRVTPPTIPTRDTSISRRLSHIISTFSASSCHLPKNRLQHATSRRY